MNDFYDMWKEYVAKECGYREYPNHPYVPEFNGWNNGIKQPSVGETVANTIKEAKRIVSDEKMAELKPKLQKALAPAKKVTVTQLDLFA